MAPFSFLLFAHDSRLARCLSRSSRSLIETFPRKQRANPADLQKHITGVWAIADPSKKPDIVVYYAHGKSAQPQSLSSY